MEDNLLTQVKKEKTQNKTGLKTVASWHTNMREDEMKVRGWEEMRARSADEKKIT